MKQHQRLSLPQAVIDYWPAFTPPSEANRLFSLLLDETPWQQDTITLYGQSHPIPRLQAWYGDSQCVYQYSNIQLHPHPWTPSLITLRHRIEAITCYSFNSVLINLYRDGQDSNGWHADNEPELGKNPVIASLSLGETRRFRLRYISGNKEVKPVSLDLTDGSLLLMSGATQHHWQHCLTKTSKAVGPRINLTFRLVMPS